MLDYYFGTCGLYSICAIAGERYIAIMQPLHYQRLVTTSSTRWTIISTWLLSAIIPLSRILTLEPEKRTAFPTEPSLAFLATSIIFHIIPAFGTMIIYIRIWREATRQFNRIKAQQHMLETALESGHDTEHHNKATATIGIILLCFMFTWMLYTSVLVGFTICKCSITWLVLVSYVGIYINIAINPAIYAWKDPVFRKAFYVALTCSKNR